LPPNPCVASQRVFIVIVYFVIDSVRKLLDTPLYTNDTWVFVSFSIENFDTKPSL